MANQTYLSEGDWAPGKRPIAMSLANGVKLFGDGYKGVLFNEDQSWWICRHTHVGPGDADACARKAWFAHHG